MSGSVWPLGRSARGAFCDAIVLAASTGTRIVHTEGAPSPGDLDPPPRDSPGVAASLYSDVYQDAGVFRNGGKGFKPKELVAYEFGLEFPAAQGASISISGCDNVCEHRRSLEFGPVTLSPPRWGNGMRGVADRVETWGEYWMTPW